MIKIAVILLCFVMPAQAADMKNLMKQFPTDNSVESQLKMLDILKSRMAAKKVAPSKFVTPVPSFSIPSEPKPEGVK